MTLVDTSAWIEFLRRSGDLAVKRRVAAYIDAADAATSGPIHFELLTGARPAETVDIDMALSFCEILDFSLACWQRAGRIERSLREKGVTVPRDDVFVAAAAIEYGVAVYAHDQHFELMRTRGQLALELA